MVNNFFDDVDKKLYEIMKKEVDDGVADPLSAKLLYESWIFRFVIYVVAVVSAGIGTIRGFILGILKAIGEGKSK